MTKIYGRPALKKLVEEARQLNIAVDFFINSDGEYVIITAGGKTYPPTAAAACFFVAGMVDLGRVRFSNIQ